MAVRAGRQDREGGKEASGLDPKLRFPDGRLLSLSYVCKDRRTRIHYLGQHHGQEQRILCLCRREGIPLGVAKRQQPTVTFYFYALHQTDPPRHAPGCPHRGKPGWESDSTGCPDVEVVGGRIRVNLDAPMYRGEPREEVKPRTPSPFAADARREGARGKLMTLLEVFWSEGELNVWRPWFEGKRHYGVVFARVLEVARTLQLRQKPLAPVFYLPGPKSSPTQWDHGLIRFVGALEEGEDGRAWYGFIGGLFDRVETVGSNAVTLRLRNCPLRIWSKASRWEAWHRRWWAEGLPHAQGEGDTFVLLRVGRREGKNGPWVEMEDLAAMHMGPAQTWVPVRSRGEWDLVARLVELRRHFRRPLSVEMEAHASVPTVVLEDRADRMLIEVFDGEGTQAQQDLMGMLRDHYAGKGQAVLFWQPGCTPEVPRIPWADAAVAQAQMRGPGWRSRGRDVRDGHSVYAAGREVRA